MSAAKRSASNPAGSCSLARQSASHTKHFQMGSSPSHIGLFCSLGGVIPGTRTTAPNQGGQDSSALSILERRYARGEISAAELE